MRHRLITALWLLTAGAAIAAESPAGKLTQAIDELCASPHRLAGTAEGRAAGDAIIRRLREAGFDESDLAVQPVEMMQLHVEEGDCYFEDPGGRMPMQPLRPNGLALPVTPPEGLDAETIYLGDGRWEHFEGKEVKGRIAVFDYNCGERWTRAVQAGAVAVLFVGEVDLTPRDFFDEGGSKCFYAHLDIPRFFVPGEAARAHGLLAGAHIRLFSRMGFRRAEGRNIMAFIPGTGGGTLTNEVVALACHYDTFGPLPFARRSPAEAANVAGLIEAAAELRRHPVERPVIVVFFDNESQGQAGQYRFHFARDAYDKDDVPDSLGRMIRDREAERAFLEARLAAIRDPVELMERRLTAPAAEDARQEVLKAAERLYSRRVTELSDARRDLNLLDRQVDRLARQLARAETEAARSPGDAAAEQIEKLRRGLEKAEAAKAQHRAAAEARLASAESARDSIYGVRKALAAGRAPGPDGSGDVVDLFNVVVGGVRARWTQRLEEQSREREILEQDRAVGARLAGKKMVAMVFWNLLPSSRRWAILGPPEEAADVLTNLHLSRWMGERFEGAGASRWPGCVGFMAGVPSQAALGVSGKATFVVELANPGAAPVSPPPPAEAAADADSYARHGAEALAFCRELANRAELSRARLPSRLTAALVFNVPVWTDSGRYDGSFVRHYDDRYKAGDDAVDAVVFVQNRRQAGQLPPANSWGGHLTFSSKVGSFPLLTAKQRGVIIQAALHDAQGQIASISLRQPAGGPGAAGNWEMAGWYFEEANNQVLLGEVKSRVMLAGIRTPTGPVSEGAVKFLDAITESPPKQMNLSLGGDMLAVYTGRLRQYKVLQGSQLLLGNSASEPVGGGVEVVPGFSDALARSAHDTWTLDESRLDSLRRRNVMENSLERLHARAERLLDQAGQSARSPGLAWARNQASLGYSDRVYEPVRAVTNDLVKAIVILLLLAVPFAFAFERSVFGSPNIYLQILGFVLVFGAVFAILYLVHPAFRFVTFPAVVLLAFIIIIMSSVVIVIMWGKFEYEVRKLHGLATASHQSTRTARGTVGAAVVLGIATMRRRPLRSVLTAVTILLLTFTILFFGSFKSEDGVRMIYVGPGPRTPMVEIGSVPGNSFDEQTVAMLRQLHADSAASYVRGWSVTAGKQVLAGRLPDDTAFSAGGQAALPPEDLRHYPELRQVLRGDIDGFEKHGGIFLPPEVYARVGESSGVATERFVEFAGRRYVLRGTFDPARLKSLRTLDGASFVPPNVAEVNRQLEQEYPNDPIAVKLRLDEMELEDYPPVDPETIVLVWESRVPQLTMPVRSLVFLPETDAQAREIAGEIAIQLSRRASVAVGGDHFRALYTKQLALGGFAKVAVPLLLGGLIIFGTMLSSVSDRQREIFTFSALGLGPRHVGALFFAEAGVYAVVGGMGGYLFAHVFAKVVEWMARYGWAEVPMMNHSSMNAMLTLLVVMATVLASTLYPAYKASRSANPGAQRQWRMPEPEGDRLRLEFPFTVSNYDMVGLVSFLEEHLLSHRERSVGLFAADDVQVRHDGDRFTLSATVWLQPFDQGISQSFSLWTEPGAIAGIDRVHVEMRRFSGSPAIWRRSSRVFIHDLRNQFILWRTIPDEASDHYYRMTASRFAIPEEGQAE